MFKVEAARFGGGEEGEEEEAKPEKPRTAGRAETEGCRALEEDEEEVRVGSAG